MRNSNILLEHCSFDPSEANLVIDSNVSVTGNDNHFAGGSIATVITAVGASLSMHDIDILNGGGPTILNRTYASYHSVMDLEHNYWGTTDSTQIAAWIVDDVPNGIAAAQIDFVPFRESPVSAAKWSLGALKARFRN